MLASIANFNAKYNIYNSIKNMYFEKLDLFRKYFYHLFYLNSNLYSNKIGNSFG
jgi:hypothetical protein